MTPDERYDTAQTDLQTAIRWVSLLLVTDDVLLIREAVDHYDDVRDEFNAANFARLTPLLEDAHYWLCLVFNSDDNFLLGEISEYYDQIKAEFEAAEVLTRPRDDPERLYSEYIRALINVIELRDTDLSVWDQGELIRAEDEDEDEYEYEYEPIPNAIPNPYLNDEPKMAAAA